MAVGQTVLGTAEGIATVAVRNHKPDWEHLSKLIRTWRPGTLVVGLPLHLDASESEMAAAARRFGHQLKQRYDCPVVFVDERLTSQAANALIKANGTKHRRGIGYRDRLAARLILQTYFDREVGRGSDAKGSE